MNEVEEVKARLDIVEVIGSYLPLQKAGRAFKAPCPFHQEKTPSFNVNPDRQSWHCFGSCATGGDVISFVMRREGLEFPEALRILAERAGVKLPEKRVSEEQDRTRLRLYAANETAAEYYVGLLKTDAGRNALRYLESRGVDDETARKFQIGYSLDTWEAGRDHLRSKGFTERELQAAGLLVQGDRGLYDRFRGRLMFAVWDPKGRVVGFGARALDDSTPKYLNTSQSSLFDKGGMLYALDKAQDAIRAEGRAVIVEGYMDVIAAHQHGFTNVVAQMGTALTDRQYALLKRVSENIVLVLDTDAAGQAAMKRVAVEVSPTERVSADVGAFKQHLPVHLQSSGHFFVALLPSGKDPDELIRTDPEAWRATIAGARPYIDFWIEYLFANSDVSTPQRRRDAAVEMMEVVKVIDDAVIRAHYLQKVSRLALVDEEELASMLPKSAARGPSRPARPNPSRQNDVGNAREDFLLALLLQYPSLRPYGIEVSEDMLWEAQSKQVLTTWKDQPDAESAREAVPLELKSYFERIITWRLPISAPDEALEALQDCIGKLQQRRLQAEKQAIAAQIAALQDELGPFAGESSDESGQPEGHQELQQLLYRDMEIGRQLHSRGRKDGLAPVEIAVDG